MSEVAAKSLLSQYDVQLWSKPIGAIDGNKSVIENIDVVHWIVGANQLDNFYDRAYLAEVSDDGSLLMHGNSESWRPCRIAVLEANRWYRVEYDSTVPKGISVGSMSFYNFLSKAYVEKCVTFSWSTTPNADGTFHWTHEFVSPNYKSIALIQFWQGTSETKFSNSSLKMVNEHPIS